MDEKTEYYIFKFENNEKYFMFDKENFNLNVKYMDYFFSDQFGEHTFFLNKNYINTDLHNYLKNNYKNVYLFDENYMDKYGSLKNIFIDLQKYNITHNEINLDKNDIIMNISCGDEKINKLIEIKNDILNIKINMVNKKDDHYKINKKNFKDKNSSKQINSIFTLFEMSDKNGKENLINKILNIIGKNNQFDDELKCIKKNINDLKKIRNPKNRFDRICSKYIDIINIYYLSNTLKIILMDIGWIKFLNQFALDHFLLDENKFIISKNYKENIIKIDDTNFEKYEFSKSYYPNIYDKIYIIIDNNTNGIVREKDKYFSCNGYTICKSTLGDKKWNIFPICIKNNKHYEENFEDVDKRLKIESEIYDHL